MECECESCEEAPATFCLSVTSLEGVVLYTANLCPDCFDGWTCDGTMVGTEEMIAARTGKGHR